jgi:hypothetical protein
VLLGAYDPLHSTNTRYRNKRELLTFTTKTDRTAIGQVHNE